MPIQFITGDLFANRYKSRAFAHGCNCEGSMGAGIATQFRGRYPEMYEEYRRRCKAEPRAFNLGDAFLWKTTNGDPSVFNLGTQEGVWRAKATYDAVEKSLRSMLKQADSEQIASIAMPRIGAGHGGLSWKKVREVIESVCGDWPGTMYVYEEYVPEEDAQETVPSIVVESRRRKRPSIEKAWPGAMIADVTSKGDEPWVRFSPFWPHGGIPVPNSNGVFAESVEGLWQGLKVFENEDIDTSRWKITNMKGIKRGGKSRGKVLGHRLGVAGDVLLGYREARLQIYLPAYRWVLENRLSDEVERLRREMESTSVVLLDYETNGDVDDLRKPLSHASLVKRYVDGAWTFK